MVIVTTHKGSDFDAMASLVAATLLYPGAKPVLPTSINGNLKTFLSIHKDLFDFYSPADISLDHVKKLVVVDTHSWDRLEGLDKLRDRKDLEIVVWDHHTEGDMDASERHVVETGATVTLIINELKNHRTLI
ncbi:MAG: DHH family phosphoesterase, partial [Desulfobacula sp.]